jgi:hypothetical protein
MSYPWQELSQLARILEDEAAGKAIDHDRAFHLARFLEERHPEIGNSMRLISDRMAGSRR